MEVLARTLLVLLVAVTAALCAPSAGLRNVRESSDQDGHPSLSRVARQAPGGDILTRLSDAFRQKMQQKSEGVMDAMDQVGKALGSLGDTVHQAISDGINAGAQVAGDQRSAPGVGTGEASNNDLGHQVGQVLSSIGDVLHGAVSGPSGQDGGQRATGPQVADEPGPDAPLGHYLTSIGDKLRTAANGGEEGERALGEAGVQVSRMFAAVGATIQDVIKERQEGEREDDEDVARLMAVPGVDVAEVPCNSMNATATGTSSRRRGRGRRSVGTAVGSPTPVS